ncbi:PREDICTED: uncharacterized protein LOC109582611 [Amphimedon queenslandica]|uniref:Uncharacterized protein n=1 Tax=Amphimedon queenslandica TaxID=400682 RepID=A0A1X7UQ28_AMPQE|nr:PREDICTED: uncharacterized protein LOC109582611 [Amphimedon queenslandica]|eukprot:XP_019853004.1 PREDICTED: uncharacterized protein LOC109582611 [Amphimedon queenslandica]
MAKSLRSKRRQKNNRIRRKKFGEREVLKAWEHYNTIQERKKLPNGVVSGEDHTQTEVEEEMETSGGKVSKKDVAKWSLSRNQKKKLSKKRKQFKMKKRKY